MKTTREPRARLEVDVERRGSAIAGSSARLVRTTGDRDWRINVRDLDGRHAADAGPAWFDAPDRNEGRFDDTES